MPTNQLKTLYILAETVAIEIRKEFDSYDGERWTSTEGKEKSVTFTVEAPSLKGKKVGELNPQGLGRTGDFTSRLWLAGASHVSKSVRGRTLHDIHYAPEITNDTYTGIVSVRDSSSAGDYDL